MATPLYILAVVTPWLAYLCWSDVRTRRLPNLGTLGMLGCALIWRLAYGGVPLFMNGLVGGALCGAFLLLPFLLRGAGGGDVKMIAAAGAVLGVQRIALMLFATSLAGFVLALVMLCCRRADPARLKHYFLCLFWWRYDRAAGRAALPPKDSERARIPFGAAIAAGVWLALFFEIFMIWRNGR
ncbi:MAG: prepilin peptidase [Lentisphaeria bacterium]|nr:prepilin peptidase [Lentisphaeria bacterium]